MFTFDIEKSVPKFILNDKNGYAIAKAIEAGMQIMNDKAHQGLSIIYDCDAMPEWRLDEMAWEYNIPYDYTADIEVKRGWIRSVYTLYRLYGTPEGVIQYMAPYFEGAAVEEPWEYGGDPYHFRLVFPDGWTPTNVAWATLAVNAIKNVRSVLDGLTFDGEVTTQLYGGTAVVAHDATTYRVPAAVFDGNYYTDEAGNIALDELGNIMMEE